MKILYVTPLFFPSQSGAAVYFDTLSRCVVSSAPESDITILTPYLKGSPLFERHGRVKVLRLLPKRIFERARALQERGAALLSPLIVLALSRILKADLIHYHTLASYRGIHYLARYFRMPLIGDMRDLAARDEGASLSFYSHCERLICASENILGFLLSGGISPERLLQIPIPLERPEPVSIEDMEKTKAKYLLPEAEPYIIFVGAVIPNKGVGELIRAMERVWERMPYHHLVLAGPLTREGNGVFPGGFVSFVKSEPRIHYLGAVPHKETLTLIQGADLFILPSRTEGLPRSCLEAISLGKKVLLPPGIPEFDRYCPEQVLREVSVDEIALMIEASCLQDTPPPSYPISRHDPMKVASMTVGLYRSVLGSRPANEVP